MIALQRARSADEYADWDKQGSFEVQDLRNCLLYDMEDIGERGVFPAFLDPLEQSINRVLDPKVQKAVNRIQSEAETMTVLEAARENGFRSVSIDLIYGLP